MSYHVTTKPLRIFSLLYTRFHDDALYKSTFYLLTYSRHRSLDPGTQVPDLPAAGIDSRKSLPFGHSSCAFQKDENMISIIERNGLQLTNQSL